MINIVIYILASSKLLNQTKNISEFYFKLQLNLSEKNLAVLVMSFKITEYIYYKGLIKNNTQTTITIILCYVVLVCFFSIDSHQSLLLGIIPGEL